MIRDNWNKYFIKIAHAVASRSEDPSTKVGSVIVTKDNTPISWGYNGFVAGCNEHGISYDRPKKYQLVIHGEMNALLYAKRDLKGAKLYCTDAVCNDCLKHILQSGIRFIMFDRHELIQRYTTESIEANIELLQSVEMENASNIKGMPYKWILSEELVRRK